MSDSKQKPTLYQKKQRKQKPGHLTAQTTGWNVSSVTPEQKQKYIQAGCILSVPDEVRNLFRDCTAAHKNSVDRAVKYFLGKQNELGKSFRTEDILQYHYNVLETECHDLPRFEKISYNVSFMDVFDVDFVNIDQMYSALDKLQKSRVEYYSQPMKRNMTIRGTIEKMSCFWMNCLRFCDNFVEAFVKMLDWLVTFENGVMKLRKEHGTLNPIGVFLFYSFVQENGVALRQFTTVQRAFKNRSKPLSDAAKVFDWEKYLRKLPSMSEFRQEVYTIPEVRDYVYEVKIHNHLVDGLMATMGFKKTDHDVEKFDRKAIISFAYKWYVQPKLAQPTDFRCNNCNNPLSHDTTTCRSRKEDIEEVVSTLKGHAKEALSWLGKNAQELLPEKIYSIVSSSLDQLGMVRDFALMATEKVKDMLHSFSKFLGINVHDMNVFDLGLSLVKYYVIYINTNSNSLKAVILYTVFSQLGLVERLVKFFVDFDYSKFFPAAEPTKTVPVQEVPLADGEKTAEPTSFSGAIYDWLIQMWEWLSSMDVKMVVAPLSLIAFLLFARVVPSTYIPQMGCAFVAYMRNMHFIGAGLSGMTKIFDCIVKAVKFVVDWVGQKFFNRLPEEEAEKEKLRKFLDEFAMWQAEVEVCSMDEYREAMVRSKKLKAQVDRLYKKGLAYSRLILEPFVPTSVQVTFRNVWPKIQKLENMATRARCMDDFRVCPFHLQLFGDPGVGKSHLIKNLTTQIGATHFPDSENLIYGANPNLDFADGYEGQDIWLIDDTFPANDYKMFVPWLQMVSNVPLRVPMAHLDDKGRMFTSKLIVSTTNTPYPKPDGMYKHQAIWRRRHILAKVRIDEDVLHPQTKQFDKAEFAKKYPGQSSNTYPHLFFDLYVPTQYEKLMDEVTDPPLNLRKPLKNLSYSEFISRFDAAYAAHMQNEAHFASGASARNRARLTRFLEEFDDFVRQNNIGSSHWYEQNFRDEFFTRPTPCDDDTETPQPENAEAPDEESTEEEEAFGDATRDTSYEENSRFRYILGSMQDLEWDESRLWFFLACLQFLVDAYGERIVNDCRVEEIFKKLPEVKVLIDLESHSFTLDFILSLVGRLMKKTTLYAYRCFKGALLVGAMIFDNFVVTDEMDAYVQRIKDKYPTATFDCKENWNDLYDEEEEAYKEQLIEEIETLKEQILNDLTDPELRAEFEHLEPTLAAFTVFLGKLHARNVASELRVKVADFGFCVRHLIGLEAELNRREQCRRRNRPTNSFRNAEHAEQARQEQAGNSGQQQQPDPEPEQPPPDFEFTPDDEARAGGRYGFGDHVETRDEKLYAKINRDMLYQVYVEIPPDSFGNPRWLETWVDPPIVGKLYYSVPVTEVSEDTKISLLFIQKLRMIDGEWYFEYEKEPKRMFKYQGRLVMVKGSQLLGAKRWFRHSLDVFTNMSKEQQEQCYNRLKLQAATCASTFWFETIQKKARDWFDHTWMFLSAMGHIVWQNIHEFYPAIAGVCLAAAVICLSTIYSKLFVPDKPDPTSVPSGRGFGRPSFAAGKYASGTASELPIPRRVREAIGVVSVNGNLSQGLKLCNRMMLICWHTISRWSSDEVSFTYWNGQFTITCMLSKSRNFHHIPGTDSCIVHCRDFPLWADIRKYFFSQADLDSELNEHCTMLVSKYDEMSYFSTRLRGIRKCQSIRFITGQLMKYGIMAEVDAQFPKGSSGAPILASGRSIQGRFILGTQSAAFETSSIVSCPTMELLVQETEKLAGLYIKATEPLWYVQEEEAVGTDLLDSHLTFHGSVPEDYQVHVSNMTEFERTRLFEYFPLKRIPAVLSPKNRYACQHPIRHSMNKHGRGHKVLLPRDLLSIAVEFRVQLYKAQCGPLRVLSMEEAIIGNDVMDHINLNTSPGLPYSIKNFSKGKHGLIKISELGELEYVHPDVVDTVNAFIVLMKQGISPPSNMQEVMKDELRPIGKALGLTIDQVEDLFFAGVSPQQWPQDRTIKTRSITVLNVCFTIIYRMYFGDMMNKLQAHANGLNEYCVGINVESVAAFRSYSRINELGGQGIDSDVANWDGGFTPQLAFAVVDIVNELYESSTEDQNLRYTLLDTVMFGYVQYENFVYQKHSGMPSGFPGTADFNTLGHILLTDVFWQEIFIEAKLPEVAVLAAKRNFSLWMVYGDDLLCVPHKALHEFITPQVLTSKYKKYGWQATSSVKDGGVHFAPTKDLVFLKRRFLVDDDDPAYVRWALDKDTIVSLIQYVRKTKSPGNQFRQNLVMALDYAADWGESYFVELRDKINLALRNEGLKPVVVLYSEMVRFKRMRYFEDATRSDVTAKALLLQRLLDN
ncbi:MAG: RNA helicase [Fushun polycipivirus 1]|nr:MAG: RNA helicase [Fushun polycipivirus 1]